MIFDTDIFIWVQRGNLKAANVIEREDERLLSVQTYMELLQCANAYSGQIGHPFRLWPDSDSGDIGHGSERSDAGCLNL